MLLLASFAASSSEGSTTSYVAKLRRQNYQHGIPADLSSSSKVFTLKPANLLVLRYDILKDRVFGSTAATNPGVITLKVRSEFSDSVFIVVFSWFLFNKPGDWRCWTCCFVCPGEIEPARDSFVTCEVGSDVHSENDVHGSATGSSGFFGRAFRSLPNRSFCSVMVFSSELGREMSIGWKIRLLLLVETVKEGLM